MTVHMVIETEKIEGNWLLNKTLQIPQQSRVVVGHIRFPAGRLRCHSQPNSTVSFFSNDEAYYYFRTACNFVNGNGISFDGIARANGYHPLWMLVCFPIFAFGNFNIW